MILKGKKVTLRPIEEDDIEFIRMIINDPIIESTIVGWSYAISKKDQKKWYDSYQNSDSLLRFIIETERDGVVGLTGIRNIDWKNGTAMGAGIRIAKVENRSKGIATDAYMTLLRYAFEELRLHRVSASALSTNIPSLRFLEKVGFKQEGITRECTYKLGKYHDLVNLGILKSDYEEIVKITKYWD